jgi:LysM repeat protein
VAEPSTPAPSGGGKGLKLGKQVGPLPVGVWIAVVGGGLAVAYFINRSRGSAPADASSTGDFGSATSGTGTGASSVWSANTAPGSPTTPMISTNVQWAQAAGNYLLTTGADPVLVDTALRKYLFNQPLNQQETAVIRAAIAQFGLPPEPLPPATGDGSPPPPPQGGGGNPPPTGSGTPTLTATPISNGQIRVDWTYPGSDVTSWDIGRDGTDTNGTGPWSKSGLSAGTRTWTFNILKGGTSYTFTLTGHTSTGSLPPVSVTATATGGNQGSGNGQQNQSPPPPPPNNDSGQAPPPPPPSGPRTYTVVKGDNLWNISKRFYGNGAFWPRIYNANRNLIGNPNLIYPGQVFVIP